MGESKKTNGDSSSPAESEYAWPAVTELPDEEIAALLVFHGLMGMAYNKQGFCEVGMHCGPPKHNLAIEAYEVPSLEPPSYPSSEPFYRYNFEESNDSLPETIKLDIVRPKYAHPWFYLPDNQADENDFRRLIDLEGHNFYNRPLKRKHYTFKPKLHVKSGVFMTSKPTDKYYYRVAPNDSRYLGNVVELVIAAVYLNEYGYLAIRIGSEELKLRPQSNRRYVIVIKNLCDPADCDFDPNSTKKEIRNDFHHYYGTFEIPKDKDEYELIEATSHALPASAPFLSGAPEENPTLHGSSAANRLEPFLSLLNELVSKKSSRDSPCGAVGFGKSDGGLGE
jgi:hypothetical protein